MNPINLKAFFFTPINPINQSINQLYFFSFNYLHVLPVGLHLERIISYLLADVVRDGIVYVLFLSIERKKHPK